MSTFDPLDVCVPRRPGAVQSRAVVAHQRPPANTRPRARGLAAGGIDAGRRAVAGGQRPAHPLPPRRLPRRSRSDVGGSRSAVGGSRSEVGGSRSDVGSSRGDVDGSRGDVGSSRGDVGGSRGDVGGAGDRSDADAARLLAHQSAVHPRSHRRSAASCAHLLERGHDVWLLDWGTPTAADASRSLARLRARSASARRRRRHRTCGPRSPAPPRLLHGRHALAHGDRRRPPAGRIAGRDGDTGGAPRRRALVAVVPRAGLRSRGAGASLRQRTAARSAARVQDARSGQPGHQVRAPRRQGRGRRLRQLLPGHGDLARGLGRVPRPRFHRLGASSTARDALARGELMLDGASVDLGRVRCPIFHVVADGDYITPPPSSLALETAHRSVAQKTHAHVGRPHRPLDRPRRARAALARGVRLASRQ